MRQKQDQDKRDLVEAQRSMSSIEAKAQRQYEADQRAAQESLKQRLGEWVSVHAATNLQASKKLVPCCAQIQAEITSALPATWYVAFDLCFYEVTAQTFFAYYNIQQVQFRAAARQTTWLHSVLLVDLCNIGCCKCR